MLKVVRDAKTKELLSWYRPGEAPDPSTEKLAADGHELLSWDLSPEDMEGMLYVDGVRVPRLYGHSPGEVWCPIEAFRARKRKELIEAAYQDYTASVPALEHPDELGALKQENLFLRAAVGLEISGEETWMGSEAWLVVGKLQDKLEQVNAYDFPASLERITWT